MKVTLPAGRVQSIDAFRGLTIFTMIFVNELAGVQGIPSWMKHAGADEDSMTFVDVVFPAFLFIVGMSIPFAAAQRRKSGSGDIKYFGHTVWRAASLMVMGVFMVNAEGDYSEESMGMSIHAWSLLFYLGLIMAWVKWPKRRWSVALRVAGFLLLGVAAVIYKETDGGPISSRWWGILGLIGWAYLIASVLCAAIGGRRLWLFAVLLLGFAYYIVGHHAFPGNMFFQHPLFGQGGHAVHAAIVVAGVLLSLIYFKVDLLVTDWQRYGGALWFCVAMVITGVLLRPLAPVSKIYATPSWAAFSIAACIALFTIVFLVVERWKFTAWTRLVAPAAVNPLLVYIIPYVVYALMQLAGLSFPSVLYSGYMGLAWAAVYGALVMAVGSILTRWGVVIKL